MFALAGRNIHPQIGPIGLRPLMYHPQPQWTQTLHKHLENTFIFYTARDQLILNAVPSARLHEEILPQNTSRTHVLSVEAVVLYVCAMVFVR